MAAPEMAGVMGEGGDTKSNMATNGIDDSHGYFESYSDLKVHEVMLKDWPRSSAYRRFFERNSELIRDKVVMDVGAGTGILSLFAASVGARKVYAIEASSMAHLCKEIVQQNGFADKIEVINSMVEDVELGEGIKVDVIVSEWMGFYLLHESMLDSVIVARDNFLAKDGIMVPSTARICLAPVDMENFLEDKLEFWTNVYGFDFSAAVPYAQRNLLQEPVTTDLDQGQVKALPQILQEFHLKTVAVSQVQALSNTLTFHVEKTSTVHGFAIWFDVDFHPDAQLKMLPETGSATNSAPSATSYTGTGDWKVVPDSVLSTSPASPRTHWKQTVVVLPRALSVEPSESLSCKVSLTQNAENRRHYNIELELVEEDDSDDSDDDDDDDSNHPLPCDCGRSKCQLIRALMDKYGEEQDALEAEAEVVDLTAGMDAAESISVEMGDDPQLDISDGASPGHQ